MWPSMNIWLLRVLPLSAYFSHSLCISLFSVSHACISPSIIRFQEFPLGVAQVLRAEKMAAPAFLLSLIPLCPFPRRTMSFPRKHHWQKHLPSWTWSHLVSFDPIAHTKHSWSRVHLKTDCLTPPSSITTFELPCWSWDFALLSSPPGAAGNWLLWPSGLYSHGEAHYCSHMAGYKDDETMWALFSNKFLLPPEAQSSFTGHISEMP